MPKPGTTNDDYATTTTTKTTTTTTYTAITPNQQYINYNSSNHSSPKRQSYNSSSGSHKKRKQYVPSKPITAFDEYLNEVKLELTGVPLSEITATAYDRWSLFSPIEKEKYEREALHANSDYVMDKFIYEDEHDKLHASY